MFKLVRWLGLLQQPVLYISVGRRCESAKELPCLVWAGGHIFCQASWHYVVLCLAYALQVWSSSFILLLLILGERKEAPKTLTWIGNIPETALKHIEGVMMTMHMGDSRKTTFVLIPAQCMSAVYTNTLCVHKYSSWDFSRLFSFSFGHSFTTLWTRNFLLSLQTDKNQILQKLCYVPRVKLCLDHVVMAPWNTHRSGCDPYAHLHFDSCAREQLPCSMVKEGGEVSLDNFGVESSAVFGGEFWPEEEGLKFSLQGSFGNQTNHVV